MYHGPSPVLCRAVGMKETNESMWQGRAAWEQGPHALPLMSGAVWGWLCPDRQGQPLCREVAGVAIIWF